MCQLIWHIGSYVPTYLAHWVTNKADDLISWLSPNFPDRYLKRSKPKYYLWEFNLNLETISTCEWPVSIHILCNHVTTLACDIGKIWLQFLIKPSHWSFYYLSFSAQHNTLKGYEVIFMTTCRNSTQIEKHRLQETCPTHEWLQAKFLTIYSLENWMGHWAKGQLVQCCNFHDILLQPVST